ncbi:MAG: hypothetical protein AB7I25_10720 [Vicinamibacterales bacterium]
MRTQIAVAGAVALLWVAVPLAQSWQPKKLSDGQPDIAGYYQMEGFAGSGGLFIENSISIMNGRPAKGIVLDPADGMIPYLPWARARRDEVANFAAAPNQAQVDTRNRGWPDGTPRINFYFVNPLQIAQTNGAVLFLYEAQHEFRYVPLDNRPQPDRKVELWMGSSRGRWEGTTLVVNATNHHDRVRLSVAGDFASPDLKVTERWTWVDRDTIDYTATLEDAKVYARPWTAGVRMKRITEKGFELMEYAGVEGDRDAHLMVDIPATNKKDGAK